MKKLSAFTFQSLDGYFKGDNDDISWHQHGAEEGAYSAQSLEAENILLFGRRTYQMMAAFWPSPEAFASFPLVAGGMNRAEKIVFSRSLQRADWENSRIVGDNLPEAVSHLKQTAARDLTLLGSGSVFTQLAEAGLIDEYQIMIDPVAIGKGTALFGNIKDRLSLRLLGSRTFKSGVVLLHYQPV
jgi:dihydrofolate reductase